MGKIRILRIIARLNIGGPAIHSILLTSGLNSGDFETILVSGRVDRSEEQMNFVLERYNVRPIFMPELGRSINPLRDIVVLYKIFRLIKKYKPHIVHTHTSKAGFVGRLAAYLAGVPVRLHTFHGHTFQGYFNRFTGAIFLNIERTLSKITDRTIAISPSQFNDIVERYKVAAREKTVVVPLGLDLEPFLKIDPESGGKEAIGFDKEDIVIGTVGRITRIKNHRLFIMIAKLLCETYGRENLKFAIVGNGELKEEITRYKEELGLNGRVRIFGWQPDVVKFYRAFDAFLLTSGNEGTPVSLIEAMAASRPVISTNVGGVPDLVDDGQTGYLFEPFNPKKAVEKLVRLVSNKSLRREIGAKARLAVRDKFRKDRLIGDMESLYRLLLKEKKVNI